MRIVTVVHTSDDASSLECKQVDKFYNAMYNALTSLKKHYCGSGEVFILNGKITTVVNDNDIYPDMLVTAGSEETNVQYFPYPEEYKYAYYRGDDTDDLRDPMKNFKLGNHWQVYSMDVNTIKEKFEQGARKVILWAFYANDGCYPALCYLALNDGEEFKI